MKKNIMKLVFAATLAVAAGVSAYQAQEKEMMSDLTMENVEALASGEGYHITCYSGGKGNAFLCKCGTCVWGYTSTTNKGTCY